MNSLDLAKSTLRKVPKFGKHTIFLRGARCEVQRAKSEKEISVKRSLFLSQILDACMHHPLSRIRNRVISRSWRTVQPVHSHMPRSPILPRDRLVESSARLPLTQDDVCCVRLTAQLFFVLFAKKSIALSRELPRIEVVLGVNELYASASVLFLRPRKRDVRFLVGLSFSLFIDSERFCHH